MRFISPIALGLVLIAPLAFGQIPSEEIYVETMPDREENWFIGTTGNGGYIFDATTGEMKGMLSLRALTGLLLAAITLMTLSSGGFFHLYMELC